MDTRERIAIVGMAGLLPGAADLEQFWRNLSAGVDASREVPAARWCLPAELIHDPRPAIVDRVSSIRGYFLDPFEPDLVGLREVAPVNQLDVLLQLALHVGNRAWRSAKTDGVDRQRVGVILGSIALPTDRISEMVREIVLDGTSSVHPLNREVTGLPARLLAQALGLGGTAYTLDAACASSLYALKLACDELQAGRADAMLAGGLSRPDCLYTQMGFSQLRALSPTGRCSPFDAAGNGLVVGEGAGIFLLKRLSDAIAHRDTIHGVIAGVGLSNDLEGNLLAPASEGQLRAMRAAYLQAGCQPDDVDLIECHATGTPVGDATEFNSLCELWQGSDLRGCAIGSVKSSVGHLLTGANAAGLLKVWLAMRHEMLPPSVNFRQPPASIDLVNSPFRILHRAEPWQRRDEQTPRRAAISGFGFGGVNAHLIVEEYSEPLAASPTSPARMATPQAAAAVALASRHEALTEITVGATEFPIPPLEMRDMLPQQLLMLQTAAEAYRASKPADPARTAVIVDVNLDLATAYYHQRWWAQAHGCDPEAASPPLTANRTMGALASIAASRIARAFKLGGPAFTVSSQGGHSQVAIDIAIGMLERGEIDQAIVGSVRISDDGTDEDDAVAVVLKRRDDAERAGDQILTIVDDRVSLDPEALRRRMSAPRLAAHLFLFAGESAADLSGQLDELDGHSVNDLTNLAASRAVRPRHGPFRASLIASTADELRDGIAGIRSQMRHQPARQTTALFRHALAPAPLAFVYPGSGNHFHGMGQDLASMFPDVWSRQQRENRFLHEQYAVDEFWDGDPSTEPHPRTSLFSQVSVGTLITDLIRSFGVEPSAIIGYSLGESASLFGMRVWRDRDGMLQRLQNSTLFTSDLAPPYNSARARWGWPTDRLIDWLTGVLAAPVETVEAAIEPGSHVYALIVNTPDECVIGGQRDEVESLVRRIGRPFVEVRGVTTAHCEAAEPVREAYRALHHLPVTPLPGVTFYSGATGEAYETTSDTAADAITAAVLHRIDFPRVVERAYRDGVRTFVEIGPGASCTRMIGQILRDRPHTAVPVHVRQQGALPTLLNALAQLHLLGHDVDLSPLYGNRAIPAATHSGGPTISIPVRPHSRRLENALTSIAEQTVPLAEPVFVDAARAFSAIALSHEAFLRFTTNTQRLMAETIALQTVLLDDAASGDGVPRALSLEQCREFATGTISNVLGPRYAAIDEFPTRVRLPDGPLMLVDRIISIEGEPLSMGRGRVVTEHYVHEDRWYLDAGRIPTCVAVEAGQADLFLSGFLGIDLVTRGEAAYRLLDASIALHGPLPRIGDLIRYDISIDHFFQQGDTHLFRFRFESFVDGRPLLTMTDGCAGFFSAGALAGGKGIVKTALDLRPLPGKLPVGWRPPVAMNRESFTARQVDFLRSGDIAAAFGSDFAHLPLENPQRLPGGMLRLVDRVVALDPTGGRFGIGLIRAEADIHPDDWFLTCHFVDDMVMPGTLMYECCLHTLRIYLMRLGWIGEDGEVIHEPVPGISSKLKCRGQVTAETRVAAYEVTLKEIGYGPEPYAIADALMYADGRPIVEMTNMSLRLSGLDRDAIERLWQTPAQRVLFDRDRITAFAIGNPSEAFGERYRVFDSERVIARLPGPPFQFLDRIVALSGEPWQMVAGGTVTAEYDVPTDEWYFEARRGPVMPFCVLLEIALQPCGWLAAYIGSALTSPIDMSFRNLGGKATQHRDVTPATGTLSTRVKITRVSNSAGMVIQHYDYEVSDLDGPIYTGDTYFGFFSKAALADQVGVRDVSPLVPTEAERAGAFSGKYPIDPPYPGAMLRMVDTITWYLRDGGPMKAGAIEGQIGVDKDAWFFKAHFHQDPVWPGSLGLESFVQLVKYMAAERWGCSPRSLRVPGSDRPHQWVYRGQVISSDSRVTVQAWVTALDDDERSMTAAGLLSVDGRIIYQMSDFVVR